MDQIQLQEQFGYTREKLKLLRKNLNQLRKKSKTTEISTIERDLEKLKPEEFNTFFEEFSKPALKFQKPEEKHDFISTDQELQLLAIYFEPREVKSLKKIISLNEQVIVYIKDSLLGITRKQRSRDSQQLMDYSTKDFFIRIAFATRKDYDIEKEMAIKRASRNLVRETILDQLDAKTNLPIIIESLQKMLPVYLETFHRIDDLGHKFLISELNGFTLYALSLFEDINKLGSTYDFPNDPKASQQVKNIFISIQIILSFYFQIEIFRYKNYEIYPRKEALDTNIVWQIGLYNFLKKVAMDIRTI